MKLIRLILRRPTSVILMILAVVVFGSASLTGMPLEYMPDMEMPMELVMVTWPCLLYTSRSSPPPRRAGPRPGR